jgi:diamine N-acetyltransferase
MKIKIIELKLHDIELILKFMNSYYEYEGLSFDKRRKTKTVKQLLKNPSIGRLYLIEVDGIAIGYFCLIYGYSLEYDGRDVFLDEIYIDRNYRRKGIGSFVMNKIDSISRKEKLRAIHLTVYKHNIKAYSFYKKNEYQDQKIRLLSKEMK